MRIRYRGGIERFDTAIGRPLAIQVDAQQYPGEFKAASEQCAVPANSALLVAVGSQFRHNTVNNRIEDLLW
jgi:hypothetical protein